MAIFNIKVTVFLATLSLLLLLSQSLSSSSSIHDLLISRGLPAGLLPKEVKYFTLSEEGLLEVFLDVPCFTKYENRVSFDSVVRANLSYGSLTGVVGLSQEELFLWLPVIDIIVNDPKSGLILFDIGVAFKQLSLSLFEVPPSCRPQGVVKNHVERKEKGFEAMRERNVNRLFVLVFQKKEIWKCYAVFDKQFLLIVAFVKFWNLMSLST